MSQPRGKDIDEPALDKGEDLFEDDGAETSIQARAASPNVEGSFCPFWKWLSKKVAEQELKGLVGNFLKQEVAVASPLLGVNLVEEQSTHHP